MFTDIEGFDDLAGFIAGIKFYDSSLYCAANRLTDMPVISKATVVEDFENIFTPKKSNSNVVYTHTSGSSGMILKIPWDYGDYLASVRKLWRKRLEAGISPRDLFITCHVDTSGIEDNEVVISKNHISISKLCYDEQKYNEYDSIIESAKPTWILGQPSFVYHLGGHLFNHHSIICETVKYIELTGEMLLPSIKNEIIRFFPYAKVVSMYGMEEFQGILYGDNSGKMDELINPKLFVEILDSDGCRCDQNVEGRIVITSLANRVFPLVRYDTGDRGKYAVQEGMCKYTITRARCNDSFSVDGRLFDGSVFFKIVNSCNKRLIRKIIQFQVIYTGDKLQYTLFMEGNNHDLHEIEYWIGYYCSLYTGSNLAFEIIVTNEPSNVIVSGGKIKYFVDLTKR